MFPNVRRSLVVAFLVLAAAPAAHAEKRLALVIGQSAYRSVPALPNPGNDARKMSELLGTAGFDVTAASDLTQNQMREAVGDFAAKVATSGPDTVALLFYAGHGLQIDGENYLVPVDVDPRRETDIPLQAVRFNDVMNTLGALQTRLRIVMLDACRNNPFPALGSGTGNGLAIVDTKAGSAGSFISYSTSPGAVAEDGNGEDSPYTTAVLNFAREPNIPIEEAFKRVRVAVNDATEGRQIPWDSSSLTTDFRFFGDAGKPAPTADKKTAADKQPSVKRSVEDWRKELKGKDQKVAYQLVVADDTVPAYEAFVAMYAQPPYNVRVRALLERRYVMQAWAIAVATNTVASYQTFLTTYANSDLAATARRLLERVRNREFGPLPAAVAALGPTCPCPEPQQQLRKRVEEPAPKKQRAEVPKERSKPQPAAQKQEGIPPEAVGIGIGIGLGLGGGMGGGGGSRSGGSMPSGGHSYGR
jgi:hypothetical protein